MLAMPSVSADAALHRQLEAQSGGFYRRLLWSMRTFRRRRPMLERLPVQETRSPPLLQLASLRCAQDAHRPRYNRGFVSKTSETVWREPLPQRRKTRRHSGHRAERCRSQGVSSVPAAELKMWPCPPCRQQCGPRA